MMKFAVPMLVCVVSLFAGAAHAQWASDSAPLTMTPPNEWAAMDDALLADTNRQVRHVTGGNFIAGWTAYESEVLLFPYLLVQHVPYTTLEETHRPTHALDERGVLQLIGRLIRSLGVPDPLPGDIDLLTFSEAYGSDQVRLVHLEADGSFVLTGAIPLGDGSGSIAYHTAGVLGRTGAAFATVFTLDDLAALRPVIDNAAATLAFAEGEAWGDLPERDPGVVGFLPPPDEPLPQGALLVGEGRAGFVEGEGFFAMASGRFDPQDALLMDALPTALRGVAFEQVLTRTPTSQRITHPWSAGAFVPWSEMGVAGPLAYQLTQAQWATLIGKLIGLDDATVVGWLGGADAGDARSEIAGTAQGDAQPWVLVGADTEHGRLDMHQRTTLEGEQMLRRLTLVVGVDGLAVFVSQAYADAGGDEAQALRGMADSLRFVGGGRLVDVPPASSAAEADGTPAGPEGEPADAAGPAGGDAALADAPGAADADAPAAETSGDFNALPFVLGGLGLVFVLIIAIVVWTSHQKAVRRREKARERRERRESGL